MRIVTLTTDYGLMNYTVAALKGAIYSTSNQLQVVDITHCVRLYDVNAAAYNVRNAYKHFPKESIHIIGIDEEVDEDKELLLVYFDNHYFISVNNGTFCMLFGKQLKEVYAIPTPEPTSFTMLTYAPNIIKQLLKGTPLDKIGKKQDFKVKYNESQPFYDEIENRIHGKIVDIDRYGNIITNLHRDFITNLIGKHPFKIYLGGTSLDFNGTKDITLQCNHIRNVIKLPKNPNASHNGDAFLIFNHSGFLEAGMYRTFPDELGDLTTSYNKKRNDTFIIQIHDPEKQNTITRKKTLNPTQPTLFN